eukprot:154887-Prymnesium_polylepis.1
MRVCECELELAPGAWMASPAWEARAGSGEARARALPPPVESSLMSASCLRLPSGEWMTPALIRRSRTTRCCRRRAAAASSCPSAQGGRSRCSASTRPPSGSTDRRADPPSRCRRLEDALRAKLFRERAVRQPSDPEVAPVACLLTIDEVFLRGARGTRAVVAARGSGASVCCKRLTQCATSAIALEQTDGNEAPGCRLMTNRSPAFSAATSLAKNALRPSRSARPYM